MTTTFREQIHRIVDRPAEVPLRCSGCGWPASELGPQIIFLSFSQLLFRGVIVDSSSGGALQERLDELVLCGECVADAAFLIDPAPARSARQKVSEEQRRLQSEITNFTKTRNEVRSEIDESEKRLEVLRKARDGLGMLRAKATEWGSQHAVAADAFRDARLRVWATERSLNGDSSPEAATELAEAHEQLDKTRGALHALTTAGGRLARNCQEKGLADMHALIRDRLAGGLDND